MRLDLWLQGEMPDSDLAARAQHGQDWTTGGGFVRAEQQRAGG